MNRAAKLLIGIIMPITLLLPCYGHANSLQQDFNQLDSKQISVLKQACLAGLPHGLCLTMAAIAWQESNLGKWNINLQDPSASWYHIRIQTAFKYTILKKHTRFNYNRIAQMLIDNEKWAGSIAVKQILFWKRYFHGSLYRAIGSYNGGYRWNRKYAREVWQKIKFLKKHIIIK